MSYLSAASLLGITTTCASMGLLSCSRPMEQLPLDGSTSSDAAEVTPSSPPPIRFKALYFDMDGTSLDSKGEFRSSMLEAVDDYRKCGGKVSLATGRVYEQVERYIPQIRPDLPLVLFNGGLVMTSDKSKIFARYNLAPEVLAKAISAGQGIDGLRATVVHLANQTFVDPLTPEVKVYLDRVGIRASNCQDLAACVRAAKEKDGDTPIKVLYHVDPTKTDSVARELKIRFEGLSSKPIISSPETVEVLPEGVDKGRTLLNSAKQFGYSRDDIMTFGDSGNDTWMLSTQGFPVSMAMAHCRKETCSAALFVGGGNNTETISTIIRRLVMTDSCAHRHLEKTAP